MRNHDQSGEGGGSQNLLPFFNHEQLPPRSERFTRCDKVADAPLVVHRSPLGRRSFVVRPARSTPCVHQDQAPATHALPDRS